MNPTALLHELPWTLGMLRIHSFSLFTYLVHRRADWGTDPMEEAHNVWWVGP